MDGKFFLKIFYPLYWYERFDCKRSCYLITISAPIYDRKTAVRRVAVIRIFSSNIIYFRRLKYMREIVRKLRFFKSEFLPDCFTRKVDMNLQVFAGLISLITRRRVKSLSFSIFEKLTTLVLPRRNGKLLSPHSRLHLTLNMFQNIFPKKKQLLLPNTDQKWTRNKYFRPLCQYEDPIYVIVLFN